MCGVTHHLQDVIVQVSYSLIVHHLTSDDELKTTFFDKLSYLERKREEFAQKPQQG